MRKFLSAIIIVFTAVCMSSCNGKSDSVQSPIYEGEITFKEGSTDVEDWGRAGQTTPDGNYFYHGKVTLFTESGISETFECYEGKNGMDKGCRGILVNGEFVQPRQE